MSYVYSWHGCYWFYLYFYPIGGMCLSSAYLPKQHVRETRASIQENKELLDCRCLRLQEASSMMVVKAGIPSRLQHQGWFGPVSNQSGCFLLIRSQAHVWIFKWLRGQCHGIVHGPVKLALNSNFLVLIHVFLSRPICWIYSWAFLPPVNVLTLLAHIYFFYFLLGCWAPVKATPWANGMTSL